MLRAIRQLKPASSFNHHHLSYSPPPLPSHTLNPPHASSRRFIYYCCSKNTNVSSCCSLSLSLSTTQTRSCSSAAAEVELETPTSSLDANSAITELARNSVVKIFTVTSTPNYYLPWQNEPQEETTGSGFVISGRRILTNAHVVANHTFIRVRKHGSPKKYRAEIQAIGHECDLAILVVESEKFWKGMNSLALGDIPCLQDSVSVVGYP